MRPIAALAVMIAVIAALSLVSKAPSAPPADALTEFGNSHTMLGGDVAFAYPDEYGLALRPEQVLRNSYIPPCNPEFDYCLYYIGTQWKGTNFESAGLRVKKRADLETAAECLSVGPAGYETMKPQLDEGEGYATARFAPLGDAAAGHYSTGALYRLTYDSACYEFETRIGESQLANYPEGAIREFTAQNRASVERDLREILGNVTLKGKRVGFPLSN